MANKKTVHIFFDEPDHELLKAASASFGMPMATYCKSLILSHLNLGEPEENHPAIEKDTYKRKSRRITNSR